MELNCDVDLDDKSKTPDEILDSLARYLKSLDDPAKDRIALNKRVQQDGESITEFRVALEEKTNRAELCNTCRDTVVHLAIGGPLQ